MVTLGKRRCAHEYTHSYQQLGFEQRAGGWQRPGFSFRLHRWSLSTFPAPALSPDGPGCPSLTSGCVRKSEKTISMVAPAQPPHRPSACTPASPRSSTAGDGPAGKGHIIQHKGGYFLTVLCQELYSTLQNTDGIAVT